MGTKLIECLIKVCCWETFKSAVLNFKVHFLETFSPDLVFPTSLEYQISEIGFPMPLGSHRYDVHTWLFYGRASHWLPLISIGAAIVLLGWNKLLPTYHPRLFALQVQS